MAICGWKDKEVGKDIGVITKSKLVLLRNVEELRDHILKLGHKNV